jgi:23S rRNA (guanosine2251-2'-O)-methyltransferase
VSRSLPRSGARRRRDDLGGLAGEQVEGRQAVRELLRARRRRVHLLTVAEGADPSGSLAEILGLAAAAAVAVRRVDRGQLDALALTEAPQGVIARADPLPEADLRTLAAPGPDGRAAFVVVLEGVTDPRNLGAVMRSSVAAGATGLVTRRHRAATLSPAALKAAAGAAEYLPVAAVPGIPAALALLAAGGVWSVALDARASQPLWDLPVADQPIALVLGGEGRGLGRLVRERCDLVVGIPLSGPLSSLNVASAATLACFEVARRRQSGVHSSGVAGAVGAGGTGSPTIARREHRP